MKIFVILLKIAEKKSNISENFQNFSSFSENFSNESLKAWWLFVFVKVWSFDSKGAKECQSCRSRKNLMLQNEYLAAKIGVDTAENEPSKVSRKWGLAMGRQGSWEGLHLARLRPLRQREPRRDRRRGLRGPASWSIHDTSLFPRLVLGWINADFGHQIVIFQHFSRFPHFCTARNSKFWRKLSKISRNLSTFFEIFENLQNFGKFS